jgi:hypothetical protein
MCVLWRRGESVRQALDRLHAVAPDPAAGRAERDSMLPAFEGLERWLDRPVRELLVGLVEAGAVTITQVELADAEVDDARAREILEDRWQSDSPLRRAASAALVYLEAREVNLRAVHLQGRDIGQRDTPYFVGLGCRRIRGMPGCLAECGIWGPGVARGASSDQDTAAAGASHHRGGPGRAGRQGPGALTGRCGRPRDDATVWRIVG